MTRFLSLVISLQLAGFILQAQVTKIYFFEQEINGGASRQTNTKPVTDSKEAAYNVRFFLFAETKKNAATLFKQLWIKGRLYSFKPDTLKILPFILRTSSGGELIFTDTLVRSTREIIIRLNDITQIPLHPGQKTVPAEAMKNNVVLFYSCKKRKQYFKTNKIQQLRPLFTQ